MQRSPRRLMLILGTCVSLLAPGVAHAQHDHAAPERLGTVAFETSCAPAVQTDFNRAVALLHSFWFSAAIDGFTRVLAQDPSCTIADWNIALSR